MSRCALALLASAWLLLSGEAAAAPRHRVAVVVGVRVNVSEERADAIARSIEQVLERELEVDVVVGDPEVTRDLPADCATQSVCLSGVAARLDAGELLFLVVVGAGDRVRVEPSRRHPVTGEITHPPALILDPDPAEMEGQIAAVAAQLLPDVKPRAAPEPEPSAPPVAPAPIAPERDDPFAGSGKRTAGIIVAAAGLALSGGATYFAFASRSAARELEDRHPPDDPGTWSGKDQSLEDRHYRDRTIAIALGITGAAAVVTGATLYLLGMRDRHRGRGLALHPTAGGGLVVFGADF